MTKDTFRYLVDELRPHIARRNTQFRRCVSVEHRIAITLWRLATSTDYRTLGSLFGVATCTVCVIFLDTIRAIETVLKRKHINIPSGQRLQVQDIMYLFSCLYIFFLFNNEEKPPNIKVKSIQVIFFFSFCLFKKKIKQLKLSCWVSVMFYISFQLWE